MVHELNNILVSIIIPVYNSSLYLDQCIQSILNQTYQNIEIILVNDGSTDQSLNICQKYAAQDKRILIIDKKNGGLVSSRKAGLLKSSGEYILYVDGDDWIESHLIKDYLNEAIKYNADVVISSHIINTGGNKDIVQNSLKPGIYQKEELIKDIYLKMMYTGLFSQFGIFSYSWGKLFKRSILYENQLNVDESLIIGEDALCVYPALLDSNCIIILNNPAYNYRQHTNSLTKSLINIDISLFQKIYDTFKLIFQKKSINSNEILISLQQYILSILTINSIEPIDSELNQIYLYNQVLPNNTDVVLYGGGTYGQYIIKRHQIHKQYNITDWIDIKYLNYQKIGLPVYPINLNSNKNLIIMIAIINEFISNDIAKMLYKQYPFANIIQLPYDDIRQNIQSYLLKYQIKL